MDPKAPCGPPGLDPSDRLLDYRIWPYVATSDQRSSRQPDFQHWPSERGGYVNWTAQPIGYFGSYLAIVLQLSSHIGNC